MVLLWDQLLIKPVSRILINSFVNFVCNGKNPPTVRQKLKTARIFSQQNLMQFKLNLSVANWTESLSMQNVNMAYESFWRQYREIFDATFPLTELKFNKNMHKVNNFMTAGLLTSRGTKIALHKQCLVNPTPLSLNNYKQFRNLYNRTLRAAKILHIKNKMKRAFFRLFVTLKFDLSYVNK